MRMIRLSILLLLIFQSLGLMAQAPQKMSYQAVLRNSAAELVVNTTVGMRISIIKGSESGTEVYVEVQKPKTNVNGLVTLAIGTGTAVHGTFSAIDWGNGPYFIKTETDPYGGASYTITGFSQFMSVPYALFAANSGSATGAAGKSAYEIWKEQPGNGSKTVDEFLTALRGTDGKSAYQVWLALSGNASKTEADFMNAIRGVAGRDGVAGKDGIDGKDGIAGKDGINGKDGIDGKDGINGKDGARGEKGESVYDIWKKDPANAGKTEADFLNGIKAVKGDKGDAGERGIAGKDGINGKDGVAGKEGIAGKNGEKGESVYDIWKKDPANAGKTEADFLNGIKAVKGDKGEKGDTGKDGITGKDGAKGEKGESVYDIWKKDPANAGKTEADFLLGIKAVKGDKGEKGEAGEKGVAGNDGIAGKDGVNGEKGESVYDIWKKDPANAGKTEADFLLGIKAVKGDKGEKGETGEKGVAGNDGIAGKDGVNGKDGEKGESVYDIWKKDPANADKTEVDFLLGIKAVKGDKGDKGDAGEKGAAGVDGISGVDGINGKDGRDGLPGINGKDGVDGLNGESNYDIWKKDPANANKTEAQFLETIKGEKGQDGKSAFELWKAKSENKDKDESDYEASLKGLNGKTILNGIIDPLPEQGHEGDFFINTATLTFFGPKASDGTWAVGSLLKGTNGVGLDFKGSYVNLAAYEAADNPVELNKAYYNSTDKKSYIYDGKEWKVFAQDGSGTGSGGLSFNVDRNITREGLPGRGTNMGAGKTTAQFLEDYFFPRLSATPPSAVLSAGSSIDIPYSVWKNYSGFSTTLNLNYTVTNKSKQDDTDDKNISSIRLLADNSEVASAVVNNTVNPQTGVFNAVVFANPTGSKTTDFKKTFQLEVKDEQPNTVTSNTLTAYMRMANRITLNTPSINPPIYVYEYGTADIPVTLNWTFTTGDETVQDIAVNGVSTGRTTTVSLPVIFKSPANQGKDSQDFKVDIKGDIYGVTTKTSPPIKWESTLYRGTISSAMAPCESDFSISDAQINKNNTTILGGSWKNDTGYDFVCDASGKYVFFAYPDDGAADINVAYYDKNFNTWQAYPKTQLRVINKAGFENASGYKGKNYKLVFVCVEYKSATVKIRIN